MYVPEIFCKSHAVLCGRYTVRESIYKTNCLRTLVTFVVLPILALFAGNWHGLYTACRTYLKNSSSSEESFSSSLRGIRAKYFSMDTDAVLMVSVGRAGLFPGGLQGFPYSHHHSHRWASFCWLLVLSNSSSSRPFCYLCTGRAKETGVSAKLAKLVSRLSWLLL